jgi:hypothetical protein
MGEVENLSSKFSEADGSTFPSHHHNTFLTFPMAFEPYLEQV